MQPPQPVAAGTALDKTAPLLFSPFRIRGCEFQNRIWVSPMCQYSAQDGHMVDFHYSHLTAFALRGPSLTMIEATSVSPEGRITPHDCGLWDDSHMAQITKVVKFAHDRKQKIGIQLAHAGRKASTKAPWQMKRGLKSEVAEDSEGGWTNNVIGPSNEQWGPGYVKPNSMSVSDISRVVKAFAAAAKRAVRAGVDVIEIHAAHGYLLSSFLSAVSNNRTDRYGGSLANRMRFALEVTSAVRAVIPREMPLTLRISATEWLPSPDSRAWDVRSSVELGKELSAKGVDVLTISSGGVTEHQRIPRSLDYQTNIARQIKSELQKQGCELKIGAVGRIADPKQAAGLLNSAEPAGDIVLVGRQFLKEPSWVLRAAMELGVRVQWPVQYQLGRYGLETKL